MCIRDSYNTTQDMSVIRNAGEAFGEFQTLLADFDAAQLYETIPDFHNTKKRYEKLEADAAADPDVYKRQIKECAEKIKQPYIFVLILGKIGYAAFQIKNTFRRR